MLLPEQRADADQVLALGGKSARGGFLAHDVRERVHRETASAEVVGHLALAGGIRAGLAPDAERDGEEFLGRFFSDHVRVSDYL